VMSPATLGVTLHWHGPLPAKLRDTIAAVAGPVRVTIRPAAYSEARLLRAVDVLTKDKTTSTRLAWAAPRSDGSGVDIGVEGDATTVAVDRLASLATTPVRVIGRQTRPQAAVGRWDDSSPFWGGAAIVDPIEGTDEAAFCSAGFGVRKTSGGTQFLLTAEHCRANPLTAPMFYTPTGTPIGDTYEYNQGTDVMTINVGRTGSSAGAAIWAGAVDETGNGVGEFSRPVKSKTSPAEGAVVCTSGAFSGERCNITVRRVNVTIPVAGRQLTGQVMAEQNQRTNAAGEGDSGGPVYLRRSDGGVSAEGTITAIDTTTLVPCTEIADGRRCAWRMYFSSIDNATSYFRITVNTV
jgi:hypothetical protein